MSSPVSNPLKYRSGYGRAQQDTLLKNTDEYKAGMAALHKDTWTPTDEAAVMTMLKHAMRHGDGDLLMAIGRVLQQEIAVEEKKEKGGKKTAKHAALYKMQGILTKQAKATTTTRATDAGQYQGWLADDYGVKQLFAPSGKVKDIAASDLPTETSGVERTNINPDSCAYIRDASGYADLAFPIKRDVDMLTKGKNKNAHKVGTLLDALLNDKTLTPEQRAAKLQELTPAVKALIQDETATPEELRAAGRLIGLLPRANGGEIMDNMSFTPPLSPQQKLQHNMLLHSYSDRRFNSLDMEEISNALATQPWLINEKNFRNMAKFAMQFFMSDMPNTDEGLRYGAMAMAQALQKAFTAQGTSDANQRQIVEVFFGTNATLHDIATPDATKNGRISGMASLTSPSGEPSVFYSAAHGFITVWNTDKIKADKGVSDPSPHRNNMGDFFTANVAQPLIELITSVEQS